MRGRRMASPVPEGGATNRMTGSGADRQPARGEAGARAPVRG